MVKESHLAAFLVLICEDHVETRGLHATTFLASKQIIDLDVLRLILWPEEEFAWLKNRGSALLDTEVSHHFDLTIVLTLFQFVQHLSLIHI